MNWGKLTQLFFDFSGTRLGIWLICFGSALQSHMFFFRIFESISFFLGGEVTAFFKVVFDSRANFWLVFRMTAVHP